jgi:hypothetical protein
MQVRPGPQRCGPPQPHRCGPPRRVDAAPGAARLRPELEEAELDEEGLTGGAAARPQTPAASTPWPGSVDGHSKHYLITASYVT